MIDGTVTRADCYSLRSQNVSVTTWVNTPAAASPQSRQFTSGSLVFAPRVGAPGVFKGACFMGVSLSRCGRVALALVLITCLSVLSATPVSAAPPRFFSNLKSSTWTAHLSNPDGSQGEVWLRKTPCGLGTFVQLKAPSVAGMETQERLVLRREGAEDVVLAVVPSTLPDFGIVIAYWPTGTEMFPDQPSDLYVQFASNEPFGVAQPYPYEPADGAWVTPEEYFEALDSGDVWVDVVVEDDVVLSGRIER